MSRMFLTNHASVLLCMARQPEATLRELSAQVGVTERAVHRIVNELVDAGAVRRFRDGRKNRYEILPDHRFGDQSTPRLSVGGFLRAAGIPAATLRRSLGAPQPESEQGSAAW